MRKPAFSSAATALRWLIPGSLDTDILRGFLSSFEMRLKNEKARKLFRSRAMSRISKRSANQNRDVEEMMCPKASDRKFTRPPRQPNGSHHCEPVPPPPQCTRESRPEYLPKPLLPLLLATSSPVGRGRRRYSLPRSDEEQRDILPCKLWYTRFENGDWRGAPLHLGGRRDTHREWMGISSGTFCSASCGNWL